MKLPWLKLSTLWLALASTGLAANSDSIMQRYREYLADSFFPQGRFYRAPQAAPTVSDLVASLNAKGAWPDINYRDIQAAAWDPLNHMKRVRELSLEWANPQSKFHHDEQLHAAISKALDYWLNSGIKSNNWWYNEIGTLLHLRDILILTGDTMDPELRKRLLTLYRQQWRDARRGDAQNSIWKADLGISYGALTGDEQMIAECADVLFGEITIGAKQGVQPDFSYYQHAQRLQTFHYGGAYRRDLSRLAWQLDGTPWALPEEKKNILADYFLQGCYWMQRNGYTVPSTLDRAVSRIGTMRVFLQQDALWLAAALPARAAEFSSLTDNNQPGHPTGTRYFPYADFLTHHRPSFSFFLKNSIRSLPAENINSENLKGRLMGAGDYYLLTDGDDYYDLPPVWDWDLLPGVTWAQGAGNLRKTRGNAIVSGDTAAVATASSFGSHLRVKKLVVTHGDAVICLVGGIETGSLSTPVRTAIDQCRLRGEVTVDNSSPLVMGVHQLSHAKQFRHGKFTYHLLQPAKLSLKTGAVTDSWREINIGRPDTPISDNIFLPVIEHSGNASAAWLIVSGSAPKVELLRNDGEGQILRLDEQLTISVSYDAEGHGLLKLQSDNKSQEEQF